MLRDYEFTMIVRPDLSEEDLAAVLAHYEQKIADREGTVLRKDAVGTKRFSYPIKKCFRGYFVNYDICANPKVVKDMEHQIRFDEKVLRHLIIGMDRRRSAAVREEVANEQKRIAEAQAESARLNEDDAVSIPPATLDDDDSSHQEETSADSPVSEVQESEAQSNDETDETAAEDISSTAEASAVDGELPTSEETVVDDLPLSEETVIDSTSPPQDDDTKLGQQE